MDLGKAGPSMIADRWAEVHRRSLVAFGMPDFADSTNVDGQVKDRVAAGSRRGRSMRRAAAGTDISKSQHGARITYGNENSHK